MKQSAVCSLVNRDNVGHQIVTQFLDTVQQGTTVSTKYSGLVYVVFETGSVLHYQICAVNHPSASDAEVCKIRQVFATCPIKLKYTTSRQLDVPRSTMHEVLHKKLRLYCYKVQLLQTTKTDSGQTLARTVCSGYINDNILEKIASMISQLLVYPPN